MTTVKRRAGAQTFRRTTSLTNFEFLEGAKRMNSSVLGFQDIDKTKITLVGGKGANLGEISKVKGIAVPDGLCIST